MSLKEPGPVFRLLGFEVTAEGMRELMRQIDADGSGLIDTAEFEQLLIGEVIEESNRAEVRRAARTYERAGRAWHARARRACGEAEGAHTRARPARALRDSRPPTFGPPPARCPAIPRSRAPQAETLFELLDTDADGVVSAGEVRALLTRAGEQLSEAEADDLLAILAGERRAELAWARDAFVLDKRSFAAGWELLLDPEANAQPTASSWGPLGGVANLLGRSFEQLPIIRDRAPRSPSRRRRRQPAKPAQPAGWGWSSGAWWPFGRAAAGAAAAAGQESFSSSECRTVRASV